MLRNFLVILIFAVLAACKPEPSQQPQQAPAGGLKKLRNATDEQLKQLRDAGAEIIVQEPEYVIVRTDKATQTLSFNFERISEQDLVQRLVHILLQDESELQQVIDSGVDFWEARGDTVVARAFDIQIENLRAAGFKVEITAENAANRKEGQE
ncbi:MAG: hypothetical protein ACE5I1_00395 [bacterium]